MKTKFFFLSVCLASILNVAHAQVEVSTAATNISVSFALPKYSLRDTVLSMYDTTKTFTSITVKDFGVAYMEGYPELPQLTVDLQIPKNAYNFLVVVSNMSTDTITVIKPIAPAQEGIIPGKDIPPFQLNQEYYSSNGDPYRLTHLLSNPYLTFDEAGIALSIIPFLYNPGTGQVVVVRSATFTLSYELDASVQGDEVYLSQVRQSYLQKRFHNYRAPVGTGTGGAGGGSRVVRPCSAACSAIATRQHERER